jgi:hypothetical protein
MSEPVSNSYKLDDMTTGEAEAFRAGIEAAAQVVDRHGRNWRVVANSAAADRGWGAAEQAWAKAESLDAVAAAIRAMEPPA